MGSGGETRTHADSVNSRALCQLSYPGSEAPIVRRLARRVVVDPDTGCWLWTGALNGKGYGQIGVEGRSRSTHRVAYEALVGPIPDGLQLDHLCRVRHCANPEHLEPVTGAENLARSPLMGSKTHCLRGHPLSGFNVIRNGNRRYCRECHCARKRTNSGRTSSDYYATLRRSDVESLLTATVEAAS